MGIFIHHSRNVTFSACSGGASLVMSMSCWLVYTIEDPDEEIQCAIGFLSSDLTL